MDLRQLRHFLALVEERSITRAAKRDAPALTMISMVGTGELDGVIGPAVSQVPGLRSCCASTPRAASPHR